MSELGWGTQIVALTDYRVVCQTRILDTTDIATFEGDPSEMNPLVKVAAYYAASRIRNGPEIAKAVGDAMEQLGMTKPLLITAFAPIMMGNSVIPPAVLFAIGVEPTEKLMQIPLDTLMTCAELRIELGEPLENIMALLA